MSIQDFTIKFTDFLIFQDFGGKKIWKSYKMDLAEKAEIQGKTVLKYVFFKDA